MGRNHRAVLCGAALTSILAALPASAEVRQFSIASSSLESALQQLGQQSGTQIVFLPAITQGKTTSGLTGAYQPADALRRLLAGTGLTYRASGAGYVILAEAERPATSSPAAKVGNETAAAPAPAAAPEIIVTAQRREERLSDVPLSITAASGAQLAKLGIDSPADLEKIALGFNYRQSAYGSPILQIRGIGFYEEAIALAPTVSVYVDQVPVPYSAMAEGVGLDVERVEVLKGPQGTLFGQNSTGGAINYIAAKPLTHFATGLDLSYGRFGDTQIGGFVTGPVSDTLTVRLAAKVERRGGWQKSYTSLDDAGFAQIDHSNPRTLGQRNFITGRLLTDWKPTDNLSFELNLNGWRDHSDTQALQFEGFSIRQPGGTFAGMAALEAYPVAPHDDRAAGWDPDQSYRRRDSFYQAALRTSLTLSDEITLTSITDYTHLKTFRPSDQDGTEIFNLIIQNSGTVHSFSEELRLIGNMDDNRLKWMVGGNYLHDNSNARQNIHFDGSNTSVGPVRFDSAAFVVSRQPVDGESIFGSTDYKLTDHLGLYASARYSWQKRSFAGCTTSGDDGSFGPAVQLLSELLSGTPTAPFGRDQCITLGTDFKPTGELTSKFSEHNLSWRVGFDWKPSSALLLYANATKGYKAGNYSNIALIFSGPLLPARQESVLAYETGFKASLTRQLQVTGAGFYLDYKGKQIAGEITDPLFGVLQTIVNIPKSRVVGGEMEANWRPVRGLSLRVGATYVDSKITSDFLAPDPKGAVFGLRGESFPGTPKWAGIADVEYEFPVSDPWKAFVGGGMNYRSHSRSFVGDDPDFRIPGYALFDARAGMRTSDGRYSITVWGRNIFNKYYYTLANRAQDSVTRLTGMPATYGISLTSRF